MEIFHSSSQQVSDSGMQEQGAEVNPESITSRNEFKLLNSKNLCDFSTFVLSAKIATDMSPKAIMGMPVPHEQEQGHLRRSSSLLAGYVLLKWIVSNTKRLYHSTTPLSCLLFPPEA